MVEYRFIDCPTQIQTSQVGELYHQAGWWNDYQSVSPQQVKEHIKKIITGSHCFLLAFYRGNAVAMGRAISDGASDAYIQDVTVTPDFRGKGIAKALLREGDKWFKKKKFKWIQVSTHSLDKPANKFWKNRGFTEFNTYYKKKN